MVSVVIQYVSQNSLDHAQDTESDSAREIGDEVARHAAHQSQ
jgi:hypothetical protein